MPADVLHTVVGRQPDVCTHSNTVDLDFDVLLQISYGMLSFVQRSELKPKNSQLHRVGG